DSKSAAQFLVCACHQAGDVVRLRGTEGEQLLEGLAPARPGGFRAADDLDRRPEVCKRQSLDVAVAQVPADLAGALEAGDRLVQPSQPPVEVAQVSQHPRLLVAVAQRAAGRQRTSEALQGL